MHLIIYFNGTGDQGESFGNGTNYVTDPDVKTIQVRGCHDAEVCNAHAFPNLAKFAHRFTSKIFRVKGQQLTFAAKDLTQLHIGTSGNVNTNEAITSITLCGYSRGAVTCFNVAKELNKIAPHIPVDIVANQPVPGNSYQGPGTNAASVADCSYLNNIKNVSIILGAYTGQKGNVLDRIHRGFFSQIVPKLPSSAKIKRDLIIIPKQHHNIWLHGVPTGIEHLHLQIAKYLEKLHYVTPATITRLEQQAKATYQVRFELPSQHLLQSFFGLKRSDAYRHIDKLHPTPSVRNGMQFNPAESLIEWWNKHDKLASSRSTQLTKDLVLHIKNTDNNDPDDLLKLYRRADKWLIQKDGSHSSRYYQVTTFRDNLYELLVSQHQIPQQQLDQINYTNMHQHQYFLNLWTRLSKEASHFKTSATRKLDRAFKTHADEENPSKQADKALLSRLNGWLAVKEWSDSKRYDICLRLCEQLSELVERTYPQRLHRGLRK